MNIKLILKTDISNLGKKGDIVEVSKGYARNFLLAKDLVKIATSGEMKQIKEVKEARERRQKKTLEEGEKMKQVLTKKRISVHKQASAKGKLYAAVTDDDIALAIHETYGFEVPAACIKHESIKTVGLHPFQVILSNQGEVQMKVKVISSVNPKS